MVQCRPDEALASRGGHTLSCVVRNLPGGVDEARHDKHNRRVIFWFIGLVIGLPLLLGAVAWLVMSLRPLTLEQAVSQACEKAIYDYAPFIHSDRHFEYFEIVHKSSADVILHGFIKDSSESLIEFNCEADISDTPRVIEVWILPS